MKIKIVMEYEANKELVDQLETFGIASTDEMEAALRLAIISYTNAENIKLDKLDIKCTNDETDILYCDILQ